MPIKIFVGNLSSDTTGEDLRPLFEQYGEVTESDVLRNFGFVHMANEEEANEAIFQLSGTLVKGQRINVEKSTGSAPRGGRGGGGKMMGGPRGRGGRGAPRGAPSRGRGHDYDPYPPPPVRGYARDPYYDYYDYPGERLPPPRPLPYPEDRLALYDREDRLRRRDPYDPYPPPPPRYAADSYYDRYPPPPPPRSTDPYERPPPHYYRRPLPHDEPLLTSAARQRDISNGYEDMRREPPPPGGDSYSSSYSSYYDRFYNKPPANGEQNPGAGRRPGPPPGRGGAASSPAQPRKDQQSALQTGPIYF